MFTGIDHVAIVVNELESAIASYSRAGFTVVRGGKHPIGTHNALVAFADGSYFELIAFLMPQTGHPWQLALAKGSGIVDFCMCTDNLAADIDAMRRAGAKIGDPSPLTRDRPDGYRLSWVLAIPAPPFNGRLPFLIKDDTPRDERVPRERSHRNGATGIRTLALAVDDPGITSRSYARVLGRPGAPVERADLEGAGVSFTIGPNEVQMLASKTENGPLADWIRDHGQSPFEVVLSHESTGAAILDHRTAARRSHKVPVIASSNIPRIVVAATGSGVGKTTATVALLGALRARGLKVAAFKCGPDYLDPTYHQRAAGVRSHNLDGWMMDRDAVVATFARASAGADIAVIEGMMGLFDSATPTGDEGSTAQLAKWLDAPVLLVTDASGVARTIAAVAAGFARFDPAVRVAGMICNRVGGRGHLDLLRAAEPEIPIVGGFPSNTDLAFPERHLGLLMADETNVPQRLLDGWGRLAAEWLDLDAIVALARSAPALEIADASDQINNRFEFAAALPNRRGVRRRVSLLLRR